jgi:hypothetical protein
MASYACHEKMPEFLGFPILARRLQSWRQQFQTHSLGDQAMFNRSFFNTKLGQASLASVFAMTAMIALSTQMSLTAKDAQIAQPQGNSVMLVELA